VGLQEDVAMLVERTAFSGVISIIGDEVEFTRADGFADRAHGIPNTTETRFGTASGSKTFCACAILGLIDDGVLALETPARSVLGSDLPLIDDAVTIEQLLAHRSGIGDYLDEGAIEDIRDFFQPISVHRLASAEEFLAVLDGYPTVFPPGERFEYNNGGYVVLGLIAERASGTPFPDLVHERVLAPAGMTATAYLRSDELPGDAAIGYLNEDGLRTNIFNLPVRGTGDGGAFTTLADVAAFWSAFLEGRIVSERSVAEMLRSRSTDETGRRYGLGFWLHPTREVAMLSGWDAGVSFRTEHDPASGAMFTVMSNTTDGAWPLVELLDERLFPRERTSV
jgi:CubicO group peptidase (beta-lactamase class C family)